MNSLNSKVAVDISFNKNNFIVHFLDGQTLKTPLSSFPSMNKAEIDKLLDFEIFDSVHAVYFKNIDEYVNIDNLLLGITEKSRQSK